MLSLVDRWSRDFLKFPARYGVRKTLVISANQLLSLIDFI